MIFFKPSRSPKQQIYTADFLSTVSNHSTVESASLSTIVCTDVLPTPCQDSNPWPSHLGPKVGEFYQTRLTNLLSGGGNVHADCRHARLGRAGHATIVLLRDNDNATTRQHNRASGTRKNPKIFRSRYLDGVATPNIVIL